jgi:hypothetical protein
VGSDGGHVRPLPRMISVISRLLPSYCRTSIWLMNSLFAMCLILSLTSVSSGRGAKPEVKEEPVAWDISSVYNLVSNNTIAHSVKKWSFMDVKAKDKTFSILSMLVDHHSSGSWYIPSMHEKYSIGWNLTVSQGFLHRPLACNIRFLGVGLVSSVRGHALIRRHFISPVYCTMFIEQHISSVMRSRHMPRHFCASLPLSLSVGKRGSGRIPERGLWVPDTKLLAAA